MSQESTDATKLQEIENYKEMLNNMIMIKIQSYVEDGIESSLNNLNDKDGLIAIIKDNIYEPEKQLLYIDAINKYFDEKKDVMNEETDEEIAKKLSKEINEDKHNDTNDEFIEQSQNNFDEEYAKQLSEEFIKHINEQEKQTLDEKSEKPAVEEKKSSLYEEMIKAQMNNEFKASIYEIEIGYGEFVLMDGTYYEGQVNESGIPHGNGSQSIDGRKFYEGEYMNGMKHGKGTYYYLNSGNEHVSKYEGEFVNDIMKGYGKFWARSEVKKTTKYNIIVNGFRLIFEGKYDNIPYYGKIYEPSGSRMYNGEVSLTSDNEFMGGMGLIIANGIGMKYSIDDEVIEGGEYKNGVIYKGGIVIENETYYGYFSDGYMNGIFMSMDDNYKYYYNFENGVKKSLIEQLDIVKSEEEINIEKEKREEYFTKHFTVEI
jgi:hypothetical protein